MVVVDVVVVVVVVIRDGLGGPKIFLSILTKSLMIRLNSFFYFGPLPWEFDFKFFQFLKMPSWRPYA